MVDNMERFEPSSEGITVHHNDDLQCKDCKFKRKLVGECDKFLRKPDFVLENRAECPQYKKGFSFFRTN